VTQPTMVSRQRRADAQRNYERLLSVARAAVAERGGDIVLEDIARQAGVAIGTLYRHFPTRQDLLEAVFLDEAHKLRARAEELVDATDPLEALITWLRLQLAFSARGRSMGAAVMTAKQVKGSELHVASEAMRAAGLLLLQRAQAAGAVRPEIELTDVLRLIYGIGLANDPPDPKRASRMFDLVLAAVRA
jgi:AcrR family transcriptional regulator